MATSLRMKISSMGVPSDGQVLVTFGADYEDQKNKEWAKYTPAASLTLSVLEEVVERNGWSAGKSYEVVIAEKDSEPATVDGSDNA